MKLTLAVVIFTTFSTFFHTVSAQSDLKLSTKEGQQILTSLANNSALLVDVRTPEEYQDGHLKFSTNIDYKAADFNARVSKLDKGKTIYLYCKSGVRSGKALDVLKSMGFKSVHNIGSFEDLLNAGLPSL